MDKKRLQRQQISDKLENLLEFAQHAKGVRSWIKYLRAGLGMSVQQLAQRMGLKTPSVYQLERMEAQDAITLKKLRQAAEALNCELVYAFVPHEKLERVIEKQAIKKASQIVSEVSEHMELEDQKIGAHKEKRQIEELKKQIINSKQLWDE